MPWDICRTLLKCKGKLKDFFYLVGQQLFKFHFTDDSALIPELTQQSMVGTMLCLDTFAEVVGGMVNEKKAKVLIGQDKPPNG